MELSNEGVEKRTDWLEKGYALPMYDRKQMIKRTSTSPYWIHFGNGNIVRAFQAAIIEKLLNEGEIDRGLVVAEGYDYEIIKAINRNYDNYSILATLRSDGTIKKSVIGSIAQSYILDPEYCEEFEAVKEIFQKDSLQMASFTITEKGYCLVDGEGKQVLAVEKDFNYGPNAPISYIGKIASLLYERYLVGKKPIAMVSMDNCSHNGTRLYEAINEFAKEWTRRGLVEQGFIEYINNKDLVSFPWTMIDKITPRPDASVEALLEQDGVRNMAPIVTKKHTYVAPFVNAEESQYLVVEDWFPNGRPELEKAGVYFTDRKTVEKVEQMKVCTCLNPLHTALAIFGCLLSYDRIFKEMKDQDLKKLVMEVGYREGLPVVIDPGIIHPKEFIDTVINTRLTNPFMPDTPQRIATDTSQKLSIRFGKTITAYMESPVHDPKELKGIALVFAAWLRYLMAVDDEGKKFIVSPDPMLEKLCPIMQTVKLNNGPCDREKIKQILLDQTIFGVDLCKAGLVDRICDLFDRMIVAPGAVRATLRNELV